MSRVNQWVAWAYFGFCVVSLLLQLGLFSQAPWGAALVGILVQTICCKGIWHYARQTACWTAYSWRILVFVQLVGLGLLSTVLWPLSMKYTLLVLLVQLPLPLMLWRYSAEEQPYWFSPLQHHQGALLAALLGTYPELRLQQQTGPVTASVVVSATAAGYQVEVQRHQGALHEQFSQGFRTSVAMAAYLEAYALIQATDFLAAYPLEAGSDCPPISTEPV